MLYNIVSIISILLFFALLSYILFSKNNKHKLTLHDKSNEHLLSYYFPQDFVSSEYKVNEYKVFNGYKNILSLIDEISENTDRLNFNINEITIINKDKSKYGSNVIEHVLLNLYTAIHDVNLGVINVNGLINILNNSNDDENDGYFYTTKGLTVHASSKPFNGIKTFNFYLDENDNAVYDKTFELKKEINKKINSINDAINDIELMHKDIFNYCSEIKLINNINGNE